jgi:hypothetical protein
MDLAFMQKFSNSLRVTTQEETDKSLLLWEEVRTSGKHPARRSYHSAVMWGDKMLVYGGQDLNEGTQPGLWCIEIGQFGHGSWERLEVEDKGGVSRHSSIVYKDKMYIFGGSNGYEEYNKTLILDLKTLRWSELKSENNLPPTLDSHTGNLYENGSQAFMIVFAGYTRGERTNSLYSLDLNLLKWTEIQTSGERPEVRSSHSACINNDFLFIFGGISDESEKLNDFWNFDLKLKFWTRIHGKGEEPTGRSGHSCVVYKDLLIIFGGMKDITKETNDMYSYNIKENVWTLFQYETQIRDPVSPDQLEEFKKTKASLQAMKEKKTESPNKSPNRISIFETGNKSPTRRPTISGDGSPMIRRRRTLYEGPLNPTEGRIRGRVPHARDGHTATVNGDIMIIFGGDRHQMPFNDTYVYYLVEENIKTPVAS